MKLVAVNNYVVLKIRPKQTKGVIATVKEEDDDFCEVVSVGPLCDLNLDLGTLVLRPTGLYEWHDEENDETFLVVEDKDICALGVAG